MARLPIQGSDDGAWGTILNDFLQQVHAANGQLKDNVVGSSQIQPDAVTSDQLSNDAVDSSVITDGSITQAKLDSATQAKLDSAGVSSVNTRTGAVTLAKSDVGLGNVDNTSDLNKPVSTATQTALDAKADVADVGAKVLLIDTTGDLPPGTPAGVVVVVKS